MKRSSFALLVVILGLNWPVHIHGCGTSTHISIGHEAAEFFRSPSEYNTDYAKLIKTNQDAFVAGNPYPDAMYPSLCFGGKFHQVAEDTHWAPFLNATVNYIRRKYKQPWNQDAQKLLSFTFGFVSHQVADVSWHSLGIDQGFIRAMADVNFHGVFGDAHSVADAGGDMVSQLEGDDIPIQQYKWHVPSKDLYEIYKEYYGKEDVSQIVIESCAELLYLEWIGEKLAGSKLFKLFAKKSPFLEEQLHNYFLGGIHDMASWTAEIWMHTTKLIEEGVDACNVPRNTLFMTCNKTKPVDRSHHKKLKNPGRAYPLNLHGLSSRDIKKNRRGNGLELFPGIELHRLLKKAKDIKQFMTHGPRRNEERPDSSFTLKHAYSEAGSSLVYTKSLSTGPTLIVGAANYGELGSPQTGIVLLANATMLREDQYGAIESDIDLGLASYQELKGPGRMTKFGWSVAVVDLNKDGVDDLAISAPSTGATELKYLGAVHVYFGKLGQEFSSSPDLTINGRETFDNFGYSLRAVDIDKDGHNDLVIGSPFSPSGGVQRGRVDIVMAQREKSAIKTSLSIFGQQDYEWFGYSTDFVEILGKRLLVVGAPAFRKCAQVNCSFSAKDVQEKGRVYIYDMSVSGLAKLFKIVEGSSRLSKFGASLSIGKPFGENREFVLAVGAPSSDANGHLIDLVPITFNQAGRVHLFNLTAIVKEALDGRRYGESNEATIASFSGDRSYGRFGMSLGFNDADHDSIDDLIIGSPYRTEDLTEEITGAERGAMYIFNGGTHFPTGDVTSNCGLDFVEPCPDKKASRVIMGTENNARLGSSFALSNQNLFVSSPRSSSSAFHGGSIHAMTL